MSFLKRLLRGLFNITAGPALALLLIFEEWGWEPLQRVMARLARLPLWARMEALIRNLPPYAALLVFFVPMLLLFPVKLLALYWISQGYAVLGVAVALAAKMLGTAAVARLFALTHPALMRLGWFARLYGRWKPWKDALIAQVKGSPTWRTLSASVRAMAASVRALRDRMFS
ncbi:MAG: hypothetical protein V4858_30280 [Pseudomonadota bacterium]